MSQKLTGRFEEDGIYFEIILEIFEVDMAEKTYCMNSLDSLRF